MADWIWTVVRIGGFASVICFILWGIYYGFQALSGGK